MDSEIVLRARHLLQVAREPGALGRLSPEEQAEVGMLLEVLPKHIEGPRLHSLFPDTGPLRRELYPKHMEHFSAGLRYKIRAFMAANRVGKSWSGGYETGCHSTGWYPPWWDGWTIDHPGNYLVSAKTTKTLKRVPQKALCGKSNRGERGRFRVSGGGMLPTDKLLHNTAIFMPNSPGTLSEIGVQFKDSKLEWSTIEFLSYEMGRGAFEGTSYDFAWCDEECPLDIYSEIVTRLMTTMGRMILTFTPLDGITEVVMQFLEESDLPPVVEPMDIEGLLSSTPEMLVNA